MANTKNLTVKISPSLHTRATRTAKKQGISLSELVRKALSQTSKR